MLARVTTLQGLPELIDQRIRLDREQVFPIIERLEGFRAAYTLVERKTGRVVAISIWESEEAEQASALVVRSHREAAGRSMGSVGPATVEVFEVAVQSQ